MHCWKTINVRKQYGLERLFILSSLVVIIVFSFAYALLGIINNTHKSDDYFWIFVIAFLGLYPIHKLFHFIPMFRHRDKIKFIVIKQFRYFPTLHLRIIEPICKSRFLFILMAPFIFVNVLLIIGALTIPIFAHYFTILFAYHCGICLIDLIYAKNLSKSPKRALIEETDAGYEILIAEPNY
ncbi:DUF3267 domain-containing protein [Psychrobacillus psychrodurans]|uniref:DUF3267 domain-containing protein n=1 Tax=Psychrobacillus TaxID=1221880 RepID=UPI001F4E030A|nr:DUF3267 domain-containing protein [Psychrobacillus psychrodurans]MCK1998200.1 DUF3267 domain-containing protein [Psychrobacillus psychrodurans]